MGVPINRPHLLQRTTPTVPKDAGSNVSRLDYVSGTVDTVRGLFQTRGGKAAITPQGQQYTFDAMFYTVVDDMAVYQRIGFEVEDFTVMAVTRKHGLDGKFSHVECQLTRDNDG